MGIIQQQLSKYKLLSWILSFSYGDFLVANIIFFPIFLGNLLFIVLFSLRYEWLLATFTGIFALFHSIFFLTGLVRFGRAKQVLLTSVIPIGFIFLYNRHSQGGMDDSPFSDGVGCYPQHTYGFLSYYRVFDSENVFFGRTYVDWSAFFLSIEFSLLFALFFSLIFWAMNRKGGEYKSLRDRQSELKN